MAPDASEDPNNCASLHGSANSQIYEACIEQMKSEGFDFVGAWYYSNVPNPPQSYSHNPEWIVTEAKNGMEQGRLSGKPWFMYVAFTICHTPSAKDAINSYSYEFTPKGRLTGDEIPSPDKSGMKSREQMADDLAALAIRMRMTEEKIAGIMWTDEAVGALMQYLKDSNQYDDTFVVFMSDHGVMKGLLYEQVCSLKTSLSVLIHSPLMQIGLENSAICALSAIIQQTERERHCVYYAK